MPDSNKIFLIGFMGSGKTTLGKSLAEKLQYPFLDMDTLIEKEEGLSIAQIFKKKGESYFRKKERKILQSIIKDYTTAVVSTGGGAPCFFDHMEQMNKAGKTIYLQLTPGETIQRIQDAKNHRPLLKGKSDKELLAFISGKLAEREPFYLQASHIIKHHDPQVSDILKVLRIDE